MIWGEQQGWRGLRGLAEGLAGLAEGMEEGPTSRELWERRGPSAVGSREERRRGEGSRGGDEERKAALNLQQSKKKTLKGP